MSLRLKKKTLSINSIKEEGIVRTLRYSASLYHFTISRENDWYSTDLALGEPLKKSISFLSPPLQRLELQLTTSSPVSYLNIILQPGSEVSHPITCP
jgi:hypothetical protein